MWPLRSQRENHVAHGAQVRLIGGARCLFGRLNPQLRHVFTERANPRLRVLAKRHACLLRAGDGLVVDVCVVDRLVHIVPRHVLERPPQYVEADERPEIPDVRACVNGGAARIQTHDVVPGGRKRLFLASQGVVEQIELSRSRF